MKDYRKIEKICNEQSELSASFVDDFLIYYCAGREKLDTRFAKKLALYRSVVQVMPEQWPYWAMSQYVAFTLFRKDGFAKKYINHSEIHSRSNEEKDYLSYQIENPWRLTFCSVTSRPSKKFFEMTDVLTNEEFLLYSPGLEDIIAQHGSIRLFFHLIGYNGYCWQTYGPHVYFKGLLPSDLLFFARQLDPDIVLMNQIPDCIEKDPLPWMLLFKGAELPLTFHKKDAVIMNASKYHEDDFEPDEYEDQFKIERKYPLYKLSLKRWNGFPHFSAAYYHKKKNLLILYSMTNRGYEKLVNAFAEKGYELPGNPEYRVTMAMYHIAQEILGRKIELNPYEKSFIEPVDQKDSEELDKMNRFIRLLMDAHNSGTEIDIEGFAKTAGINIENAHRIAQQILKKVEGM